MKKRIAIFFAMMLVCLSACGQSGGIDAETDPDMISSAQDTDPDADDEIDPVPQYTVLIPDDFSSSQVDGYEFFYVNENGSSISLNIQETDNSFGDISPDEMRKALIQVYADNYDEEVQISDLYFSTNDTGGYPSYQYSFAYELQGSSITQLVVGIDADATYTFTYTDMSGDWMDIFEESAAGITFNIP